MPGAITSYTAQEEADMAVIRRWCDEGWTKGHVEVADELIHPNFKVHGAGGQVIEPGVEGLNSSSSPGGPGTLTRCNASRTSWPSATR